MNENSPMSRGRTSLDRIQMSAYRSCLLIGFCVVMGWEKEYVIEKLDIGPVRIRLILFGSADTFFPSEADENNDRR